jgi:hypothetical protein
MTLGVGGRSVDGCSLVGGPAAAAGAGGAVAGAPEGGRAAALGGMISAVRRGSVQEIARDISAQPIAARKPNDRIELGIMPVD